jgi:hypothetical protein
LLGLSLGAMSGKGLHGWMEWKDKIGVHNYEMTFGEGRVGLKHIFTHDLASDSFEKGTDPRKHAYARQKSLYYLTATIFFVFFFAAIYHRSSLHSVIFSVTVVYILFVPSHYYWSIAALLPLWSATPRERWNPALLPGLTAFFVPAGWYRYAQTENFQYAQYIRFDYLLGIGLLATACYLIYANLVAEGIIPGDWPTRWRARLTGKAGAVHPPDGLA